jgi:hypothetical protein
VGPKTKRLIDQLRQHCDEQQRGRRTEVSKILGVTITCLSDWLNDRRTPTAEQILDVQEYLREARNRTVERK